MLRFQQSDNTTADHIQPAIAAMMQRLAALGVNLHGFSLVYKGEVLAERYYQPFCAHTPHRMYSAAKTLTGIGIGVLARAGAVAPDDAVCGYFPKECGANPHPYTAMTTIRDLLTMTSPHSSTTFKRYDGSWVESFFRLAPDHVPGTVFAYDTSATHVLGALIEKLSGMELAAYLNAAAFSPLELSSSFRFLKDPYGVSKGGSGLMGTLRDFVKIAWLLTSGGVWGGTPLLPMGFVEQAAAKQVPTDFLPMPEERHGYGWQVWRTRKNGFVLYGMGGQLAFCLPEDGLTFVTIADTIASFTGVHDIHRAFWELIYPCVTGYTPHAAAAASPSVLTVNGRADSPLLAQINGRHCRMDSNSWGLEALRFSFGEGEGCLEAAISGEPYLIPFGFGRAVSGSLRGIPLLSSGGWLSDSTLGVRVSFVGEELGESIITVGFRGQHLTAFARQSGEYAAKFPKGYVSGEMVSP